MRFGNKKIHYINKNGQSLCNNEDESQGQSLPGIEEIQIVDAGKENTNYYLFNCAVISYNESICAGLQIG